MPAARILSMAGSAANLPGSKHLFLRIPPHLSEFLGTCPLKPRGETCPGCEPLYRKERSSGPMFSSVRGFCELPPSESGELGTDVVRVANSGDGDRGNGKRMLTAAERDREVEPGVAEGEPGHGGRERARYGASIRTISGLLAIIAIVVLIRTLPIERLLQPIQTWVESLGVWGPVALGGIYVVAALLLIPGSILTLAAGALYGLALGTVIASLASTTAAAIAFLIARYLAREKVRRKVEQSPKLEAVDQAIGEQGWKIVAMLRLSPAVPFNLQNYLYGVTAIRFWPCVLVSWVSMLPGTFLYVYLGAIGKTAAVGRETTAAQWTVRIVGLVATVAVTAYLTWLARNAMAERTDIAEAEADGGKGHESRERAAGSRKSAEAGEASGKTAAFVAATIVLMALATWATLRGDAVRAFLEQWIGQ